MTTIAFSILVASLRGTEVAIYDYAVANEEILHNKSIILIQMSHDHNEQVIKKFRERFEVYFYTLVEDIEKIMKLCKCKVLYTIAYGERRVNDPTLSVNGVYKTALHCVFSMSDPHADTYIPISEYLAEKYNADKNAVVPHMISLKVDNYSKSEVSCNHDTSSNNIETVSRSSDLPNYVTHNSYCNDTTLRNKLCIPSDAIVFGRHGGYETFNIPFVHQVIASVISKNSDSKSSRLREDLHNTSCCDIYFIFVNTYKFMDHPRVKFLPPITSDEDKLSFILSCDAMIHARADGETFGIACGEFSVCNKPVITCVCGDTAHIDILGKKCIKYANSTELENILTNFKEIKRKKEEELKNNVSHKNEMWNAYSQKYSARPIIDLWWKYLIEPCVQK